MPIYRKLTTVIATHMLGHAQRELVSANAAFGGSPSFEIVQEAFEPIEMYVLLTAKFPGDHAGPSDGFTPLRQSRYRVAGRRYRQSGHVEPGAESPGARCAWADP